jgi:hypothetical protein
LLLRSLLAIGSDMANLLRVIGGLDLIGMVLVWWIGSVPGTSNVFGAWRVWVTLRVASGCADGDGDTAGGFESVVAGAIVAMERVTRLICAVCSRVAVDWDDAIGWVGADGGGDVAFGGTGGVVGRVACLNCVGSSSSSSLLLR